MLLGRREWPIFIFSLLYITTFTLLALRGQNFEFLLYAAVVIGLAFWIVCKQRVVRFGEDVLWGLSIWGLLHMAGGTIPVTGDVLYSLQLLPQVLRYDQLVHGFGFGCATLVCHHLLRPYLRGDIRRVRSLAILIVLMGSGLGAVNEILEFVAVKTIPETHVGGHDNTACDLIFNLLGGVGAVSWLTLRGRLVPGAGTVPAASQP